MEKQKTKEIDPAISQYFSRIGKKGWQAKKKKILEWTKIAEQDNKNKDNK